MAEIPAVEWNAFTQTRLAVLAGSAKLTPGERDLVWSALARIHRLEGDVDTLKRKLGEK